MISHVVGCINCIVPECPELPISLMRDTTEITVSAGAAIFLLHSCIVPHFEKILSVLRYPSIVDATDALHSWPMHHSFYRFVDAAGC